jgi:hypothetical protein
LFGNLKISYIFAVIKIKIMEIQKAYKLSLNNMVVDEPWYYNGIIVYADSHGEAKSKGFNKFELCQIEDYSQRNYKGEPYRDYTFMDIRARRVKKLDKILYDGEWRTQERIKELEWMKERDRKAFELTQTNPNDFAVVFAGCYNSYWGANRSGYWAKIEDAGKYTTEEAYKIVKGSDYSRQETVVFLDKEKYNEELQKKIYNLQKSLL